MRPAKPLPTQHSITSFAGTYSHPTYGVYDFCEPPSPSESSSRCHTSDAFWNEVQHANAAFGQPTLGAAITAAIANFVQLEHFSGNIFNMTLFEINNAPTNDEVVVVPWFDEPRPTLEFALDEHGEINGFGLTHVWGEGEGVALPEGKTVKERAEIWFDRLS